MLCSDFILLPLAFWSAIALRLGSVSFDLDPYIFILIAVPFLTIPIFIKIGLYRAVIRYVDDKIIYTIFVGVTLSILVITFFVAIGRFVALPRSSIFIYWVMAMAYIGSSRYLAKGFIKKVESSQKGITENVAIYGAGQVGLQTALALYSGRKYKPVAFFDDNVQLQGSTVAGLTVYSPDQAKDILIGNDCKQLLFALPHVSRAKKSEIIKKFEGINIGLKTVPALNELIDGNIRIEDIRDVGVEDLLGRDPVPPNEQLISKCVTDKNILVTGAGGSIGSELCRQIAKLNPKKLILFEINEFNLYKLDQELKKGKFSFETITILGDILNFDHLSQTIKKYQISTIYHAAAFKHVPLVEENVSSGILNNVFGTLNIVNAAKESQVENCILISTDKAVRPTNVMGATKRLAEQILQAYSVEESRTRFSMVRFGNVLGSSGSVVPLFKEQIKQGGPITVTHQDVIRYFMTIPEAAQLVLQAGSLANQGDIFVLDMGEPVKIIDLAKKMIELSGLSVYNPETEVGDISIQITGLRPGEKLFEELLIGNNAEWTEHPRIMRAREDHHSKIFLDDKLKQLRNLCLQPYESNDEIISIIKVLVPEYSTVQKGEQ